MAILIISIVIGVIILLWLFAIMPSIRKNELVERLGTTLFAHRGLHDANSLVPENSISAFKKACQYGYGIELDVHLSKDGTPIVMHDNTVDRTTNGHGNICELTDKEIASLYLKGTTEKVPFLKEVLNIVDGKVPLLIELKSDGSNRNKLCEQCFKLLDNYKGDFIVESFDPRILRWVRKNRKNVGRGQLATGTGVSPNTLKTILKHLLLNFLSRPHFIAYDSRYVNKTLAPNICKKVFGSKLYVWTITNKADLHKFSSKGVSCIFEGFKPNDN